MKQSDRIYKKGKRQIRLGQGLFTAGLSGALALGLLAACAQQPGARPTVTQDDLTQSSAVQDVLEQDAGNGKSYAYRWEAGDIEAAMAQRNEHVQAYLAQLGEQMEKIENMTPEELAEAGFGSVEQAREQHEQAREYELEGLEAYREYLEEQAALDPAVSPQEAANRAGVILEELYGVDLSQKVLELECRETSGDDMPHPNRVGALRPIWSVFLEEAADGVLFSTSSVSCTMDATTGEIVFIDYTPSAQEFEERRALPYPACFVGAGDDESGFGRWDETEASFAPMLETAAQSLRQLLSGSPLVGGAQVTEVRGEITEYEEGANALWLYLSCDDGKSYRLQAKMPYDPFCTEGAGTPYPMRGFRMWNDTYQ